MPEPMQFTTARKDEATVPFRVNETAFEIQPIRAWPFIEWVREIFQTPREGEEPDDPMESMRDDARKALILHDLFADHMSPAEFARWDEFARGVEGPDITEMMAIVQGLVQGSAERPTSPPSSSGRGRSSTEDGSTASSSSGDSTSRASSDSAASAAT